MTAEDRISPGFDSEDADLGSNSARESLRTHNQAIRPRQLCGWDCLHGLMSQITPKQTLSLARRRLAGGCIGEEQDAFPPSLPPKNSDIRFNNHLCGESIGARDCVRAQAYTICR